MDLCPSDGLSARRAVLALLGSAAVWTPALRAQGLANPWRIAFLAAGSAPQAGQFSTFDAVTAGLRQRGYLSLQTRAWFAEGRGDTLTALARQVLDWKPDLIVTNLTPATLAAQRATKTVPIVMAGSGDPVATGLVRSLSRPGGNVTGVAALGPELAAKSIELLRELRPDLRRLGVLANVSDSFTPAMLDAVTKAAALLALDLQVERVAAPAQYAAVFDGWRRDRVDALFVQPSLPGKPAADLALQYHLPACSFVRSFVEQGGLLAYANNLAEIARRVVDMVDRILRGAAPAELPVHQNTRFELIINRRTVAALRLEVPAGVLARATELLE